MIIKKSKTKSANKFSSSRQEFRVFNLSWLYAAWLQFLIRYRRTLLGPLWIMITPLLFICFLGSLFSEISKISPHEFIPHLAVGLITWSLINSFVTSSTLVFVHGKAQILQGNVSISSIVMMDVFSNILTFLHQVIIIVGVLIYYKIGFGFYSLLSFVGFFFLILNGIWLSFVFGILGARYRDLLEVVLAVMRIAFLATPIIWLPGDTGRGGLLSYFLTFNPFYHFLEIVRAPLLGNAIEPLSWIVVIVITVFGGGLAFWFHRRFSPLVPLWI